MDLLTDIPVARDNVRGNPTVRWVRRGCITHQTGWLFELPMEEIAFGVYAIRDRAGRAGLETCLGLIIAAPTAAVGLWVASVAPPGAARWQLLGLAGFLVVLAAALAVRGTLRRVSCREVTVDVRSGNVKLEARGLFRSTRESCTLDEIEVGYCAIDVLTPAIAADSVLIVTPAFTMVFIAQPMRVEGWRDVTGRLPAWMKGRLVRGMRPLSVLPLP